MAKIDSILNGMRRYGALRAVLKSGSPIMFRFPSGNRYADKKARHEDIVALVQEIVDPDAEAAMAMGEPTRFTYRLGDQIFGVGVDARGNEWTVTIDPEKPPQPAETEAADEARKPVAKDKSRDVKPADHAVIAEATAQRYSSPPSLPPGPASVHQRSSGYVDGLLVQLCDLGGSDLHMSSGSCPWLRVHGSLKPLREEALTASDLLAHLQEIMPEPNAREFEERNDTDFAYEIDGLSRFRVNLFRDRLGPGAVIRRIPYTILTPEQLGLSREVLSLCNLTKGLVLVTGPTGSGKSTTLATLIDHINRTREDHIITIEDPIEFVHQNKKCLVNQREVHQHTRSFRDALRAALREDPDIVLVGEMRDLETIAIAVETAETGHLVFGTLHTTTAPSTVDRIIDQFPADRQEQIRQMVAESLRGVIAQNLCRKKGGGRVAAFEVLIGSPAVSNLIRERKTFQLKSVMQTGGRQGMITLNDSLLSLVKQDLVEPREAVMRAADKEALINRLKAEGYELNDGG